MESPQRRNPHPVTFKYRVERSNIFGSIKRPVAKTYLRSKEGEWLPCFIYIDSGADFTLIPYKLGLSLRFEMEREIREVYGVGGGIPIVVKSMEMKLGDMLMNARVGWSPRASRRESNSRSVEVDLKQGGRPLVELSLHQRNVKLRPEPRFSVV